MHYRSINLEEDHRKPFTLKTLSPLQIQPPLFNCPPCQWLHKGGRQLLIQLADPVVDAHCLSPYQLFPVTAEEI